MANVERRYIAIEPLFHTPTGKRIEPGQPVDLSHLTYDQIEMLKGRKAVREEIVEVAATEQAEADPQKQKGSRRNGAEVTEG